MGLLCGDCVVFVYVCLLVLMRVEGFRSHFIVKLSLLLAFADNFCGKSIKSDGIATSGRVVIIACWAFRPDLFS